MALNGIHFNRENIMNKIGNLETTQERKMREYRLDFLAYVGVNRGTQIRRSALFVCPKPLIRRYFGSIHDPHQLTTFLGALYFNSISIYLLDDVFLNSYYYVTCGKSRYCFMLA